MKTFAEILADAIRDLSEHGFDSVERVDRWVEQLRAAARRQTAATDAEALVQDALAAIYRKLVERGGLSRFNPGVSRFTLERVKPKLRAELDRRIMASAQLIRNNREEAIDGTLRRFRGWATSVPAGGSDIVAKRDVRVEVAKPIRQLDFNSRRVIIDQSAKLNASISAIVAVDSKAIAAVWSSQWRRHGYDARPEHKARDGKVFAVRGNWAIEKGLMTKGPNGYTDEIEQPAEFVFCSCAYRYLHNLRSLPEEFLTAKGKEVLAAAKQQAAGMLLAAPPNS